MPGDYVGHSYAFFDFPLLNIEILLSIQMDNAMLAFDPPHMVSTPPLYVPEADLLPLPRL